MSCGHRSLGISPGRGRSCWEWERAPGEPAPSLLTPLRFQSRPWLCQRREEGTGNVPAAKHPEFPWETRPLPRNPAQLRLGLEPRVLCRCCWGWAGLWHTLSAALCSLCPDPAFGTGSAGLFCLFQMLERTGIWPQTRQNVALTPSVGARAAPRCCHQPQVLPEGQSSVCRGCNSDFTCPVPPHLPDAAPRSQGWTPELQCSAPGS